MKKKIYIFLIIIINFQLLFSQDINTPTNTISVIKEDFNGSESVFPILTTMDNYFIIDNGDYLLSRNNTESEYAILASTSQPITDFILKTAIKIGPSSEKRSSAGVLLKAQINGTGALVFEINRKGEYRVKELTYNQTYNYLTGKTNNEGWIRNKNIKEEGNFNSVEIRCKENIYDIYVNKNFITSVFNPTLNSGKMGILIGKDAKARIAYYYVDIASTERNELIESHMKNFDLEKLNTKLKELESEIITLKNSNKRLINENDNLKEEDNNEKYILRLDQNKKTLDSLLGLNDILKLSIKKLDEEIKNNNQINTEEINNYQQKIIKLEDDLEKKVNSKSIEIENLENNLNTLESKIRELENTNRNLLNENNDLQNDKSSISKQLSSLSNDNSNIKDELNNLNKLLKKKNSIIEDKINTNLELENTNRNLLNENNDLQNDNSNIKDELNNLNKLLEKKNSIIEDKINTNLELEKETDKFNEKNEKLTLKLKNIKEDLESYIKSNNQYEKVIDELTDLKSKNLNTIKNLKEEYNNSLNIKSNLQVQLNDLEKEVQRLNIQLRDKTDDLDNNTDIINEKKLKIEILESEIKEKNTLNRKINELPNELILNKENNDKCLENNKKLIEQINTQSEINEKLELEIIVLKEKLENLTEVIIYKGFENSGIDPNNINDLPLKKNNETNNEDLVKENIIYSVQIAAYSNKVNINRFIGVDNVFYNKLENGSYLYMSGKFNNSIEATEYKNKLVKMGYVNSFVLELN